MGTPTVRQRKVARALRTWRSRAGMTLDEVSDRLRWSISKLSRLERAETIPGPAEVIVLATIYGIPEAERDAYAELARNGRRESWFRKYPADVVPGELKDFIELEAEAVKLDNFETIFIPGLLQTEDYAKALARGWDLNLTDEVIETRAAVRMQRQARLHEEPRLELHTVIYEPALRVPVGGRDTMRTQLHHLLDMAQQPNITVQVLREDVGAHPAMGFPFCILHLGNNTTPVVYMDALMRGVFVEEEPDVERCSLAFERLIKLALDPDASADLIQRIAQDRN